MKVALPLAVVSGGCDCSTCPFYMHNPNATEPVCSGCNTDCSYCGCTRHVSGSCGECSVRCRSRVDLDAWLADVGGTVTFDDIDLAGLQLPAGLPRFIPQVDTTEIAGLDTGLGWPAYAIGLRRVVSESTYDLLPAWRDKTAHEVLGLPPNQLAVLVAYGKDPLVEGFWTRRHRLLLALSDQAWDLVLAPNYSAYANFPRMEMLLNFRRNLLIAQEMLDAGIPAVPNLYSFRLEDLERTADWLDTTRPPAVAVNMQTQRDDESFDLARPALAYLSQVLPEPTQLIVTGSSRKARLDELIALFGHRLIVVSQNAIQYGRRGAVMTLEGRRDLHAQSADAFAANVRFYAGLIDSTPETGEGTAPAHHAAAGLGEGTRRAVKGA